MFLCCSGRLTLICEINTEFTVTQGHSSVGGGGQTRERRSCLNITDVSGLKCGVGGFKRKLLQQQNSRESIANIDSRATQV